MPKLVEQLEVALGRTRTWSWTTRWTSFRLWPVSLPASRLKPKVHRYLPEQNLYLTKNPHSSSSSPWWHPLPSLSVRLKLLLPSPPSPDRQRTVAVAQGWDPAAREPALPAVPTASQGRPHQYRTPRCSTTAPTVTYISPTTSSTPSTWVAMVTRTLFSVTYVDTDAETAMTLPVTLQEASTNKDTWVLLCPVLHNNNTIIVSGTFQRQNWVTLLCNYFIGTAIGMLWRSQ